MNYFDCCVGWGTGEYHSILTRARIFVFIKFTMCHFFVDVRYLTRRDTTTSKHIGPRGERAKERNKSDAS